MIQNHHAEEACGRIATVFVTAHADDKVERAATRRHERALPSPLSSMMICQYRLPSSSIPSGCGWNRQQRAALTSSESKGLGDAVGRRDARVIAVVDDDEGFRSALQRFLRSFALQVEAFASGEEFLRSNRLGAIGCVILDVAMPEMNGLEVQQQVVARGLQIPIVFVTAHWDDELGRHAAAGGARAVLRKPVDHEELVRLVREALAAQ